MSIDLGALPPEVSSAMIYAGPGSGSLMTAAAAWNGLAAELNSAALGYEQVITQLAGEEWLGPASGAMAAAAEPYVTWMSTTAGVAEQTASQHMSAAAAYETALASVVPPPMIALNRAELSQAMATNILGQNNGIIAQLEAQYAQFWAQNASALYSYAGQSAAATKVTPVQNAPNIVNPSATTTQAAAVTAAQATPAATIQDFLTQIQQQLGALAGPLANPGITQSATNLFSNSNPLLSEAWFLFSGQTILPSNFGTMINGYAPYASLFYNTEGLPYFSVGMGNFGVQMAKTLGAIGGAAPAAAAAVPKSLPGLGGLLGGGAGGAAAHLGSATSLGKLSVPATWASAVGPGTVGHAPQLVSTVSAAPEAAGGGNLLGGMPLAGMGTGTSGAAGPRYGFKPTVMARPPLGG